MTPRQDMPRNLPSKTAAPRARAIAIPMAAAQGPDIEALLSEMVAWVRLQVSRVLTPSR